MSFLTSLLGTHKLSSDVRNANNAPSLSLSTLTLTRRGDLDG
jgi:hypothetical protein